MTNIVNAKELKGRCPSCGRVCKVERWRHTENGRLIEALYCSDCNADYGRYLGEHWRLIYKGQEPNERSEDYD